MRPLKVIYKIWDGKNQKENEVELPPEVTTMCIVLGSGKEVYVELFERNEIRGGIEIRVDGLLTIIPNASNSITINCQDR